MMTYEIWFWISFSVLLLVLVGIATGYLRFVRRHSVYGDICSSCPLMREAKQKQERLSRELPLLSLTRCKEP
jgi:hypothetical protein